MKRLAKAHTALTRAGGSITWVVGTMYVAILFAAIAFISLPAAIHTGDPIVIVGWIAQTFFQLVLLPVIIVGQNLQGKASEARSIRTLEDVEKLLALQTAHIAREHRRTRAHLTALVTENEATS